MAKALVLSNVNFQTNALTQISFSEDKSCTAVVLNYNTLSFDTVGETKSLTATLTPADTTDTLSWSTSNANVATVANGVVTIHGIGTATITATCGQQTATCSISQSSIKAQGTFHVADGYYVSKYENCMNIAPYSNCYVLGQSYIDDDDTRAIKGQSYGISGVLVPYGATVAKIKTTNNTDITLNMISADPSDYVEYYAKNYPKYITLIATAKTETGTPVNVGECILFDTYSALPDTPEYIYFE